MDSVVAGPTGPARRKERTMTDHDAVYEPPALVELGDFTDVTLGYFFGLTPDWLIRFFNLCPTGC